MNTSSLTRLGGLALLLAEVLFTLVNVWYFRSGQTPTDTPRAWLILLGSAIQTLGLMALYATLAPRSGVVGLVGFILLVCAQFYSTASTTLSLAVAEKLMTAEQLSRAPAFGTASTLLGWLWPLGYVVFGVAVYRAGPYPKLVGVLLVLLGPLVLLTGPLALTRPIFAVLHAIVWGWLGWALWRGKGAAGLELKPTL